VRRLSSDEAFLVLVANKLLTPMRRVALVALQDCEQPATASEIASRLTASKGGRGQAGNLHARLGELRTQGVVAEAEEIQKCSVTGNSVIGWYITGNSPIKYVAENKATRKELEAAVAQLTQERDEIKVEVTRLKDELNKPTQPGEPQ